MTRPEKYDLGQRVTVKQTGCYPSMPSNLWKHIGRTGKVVAYIDEDDMYLVELDTAQHASGELMEPTSIKFYAVELQKRL